MAVLPNGIYQAEYAVDESRELARISDIQSFIRRVLESDWWRERHLITHVELYLSWDSETGAWRAKRDVGELHIWRPVTKMGILHELAHLPTWVGNRPGPDHNRAFVKLYVELVSEFLGTKQANELRDEIIRRKVYGYRVLC